MKWFTATNECSLRVPRYFQLQQVAVESACRETSLSPHLLYDGGPCRELDWFESRGVTIVPARLRFREQLRDYLLAGDRVASDKERLFRIRSGAFLRLELPGAIRAVGIEDEYVLYTDSDVLFVADPDFRRLRPKFFAAAGRREGGRLRNKIGGYIHYNSGVMVMNVNAMLAEYDGLVDFVVHNGRGVRRPVNEFMRKNLFLSDQVALNLYFRNRVTRMSEAYNWNPSRGVNRDAKVVHFNGLKWNEWGDYCDRTIKSERLAKFDAIVGRNPIAYEHYTNMAIAVHSRCGDMSE